MLKSLGSIIIAIVILGGVAARPCSSAPLSITPFHTFNQSPLVQIYGLPAAESAIIRAPGRTWTLLALDLANNYATDDTSQEEIVLDGETYRLTLALRHGVSKKLELGLDLPLISHNGGIFDGPIEEWHEFFGLSQGNRRHAGHGRLLFSYSRDGEEKLRLDHSNLSPGDLRLTGGWQLYHDGSPNPSALALRASLKIPTGSSAKLHGSGSTDLALWITGSDDYQLPGSWGHMALFAAAGGLAMTDGEVLKDQQRNLAGFGSLGFGWSPADWIALKAQLSAQTPFYSRSDLRELDHEALQLLFGATCAFSSNTALDIAFSEDISVATSPDVALHLGLSHQF